MKNLLAIIFSGLLVVAGVAALAFAASESGLFRLRPRSGDPAGGGVPGGLARIDSALIPNRREAPAEGSVSLPSSWQLEVPALLQLPELPNGCEATSLAMVLQYLGCKASKEDLASFYIPSEEFIEVDGQWYGGDPERVYPGDPAEELGFYCYPGVLARAANRYFNEQGLSGQRAVVLNGLSEQDLEQYIAQGQPVMLWLTTDLGPLTSSETFSWRIPGEENAYVPYVNMHVVVVCGYDKATFSLRDPLGTWESLSYAELMASYLAAGGHAMVFRSQ